MTKERLLEGILKLPTIEGGTLAEDDQVIEGNQGGVHYKLTKEVFPFLGGLTLFSLSVSGPIEERLAFIDEIKTELGEPANVEEFPRLPGIHFAAWEANAVE
ncbi:MAG TPA: hypothetical protein VMX76_01180 [Nevskiaceae bacterium]|nr:hypothetical protein [Nevskiaceae bacterium]